MSWYGDLRRKEECLDDGHGERLDDERERCREQGIEGKNPMEFREKVGERREEEVYEGRKLCGWQHEWNGRDGYERKLQK